MPGEKANIGSIRLMSSCPVNLTDLITRYYTSIARANPNLELGSFFGLRDTGNIASDISISLIVSLLTDSLLHCSDTFYSEADH